MSGQERWDVALKVLDGPLQHMGEQTFRGPVVRIGAEPGAGGFRLAGYRGLDKRHAVITAYDQGTATIAPVGSNQVRMAPHQHVDWKEIDPMSGPEYLSEGCALHLGPVNRGCTVEFVECRKLGVWAQGNLASEVQGASVASAADLGQSGGIPLAVNQPGAPPAAFDARSASTISASSVPFWFVGCLFMMAASSVTVILAAVAITVVQVDELGPVKPGEEMYDYAALDEIELDENLLEGLQAGYLDFVMKPNAELSGKKRLENPEHWDETMYEYVTASVQQHIAAWRYFKRLDAVVDDYAIVTGMLRDEGLPEVLAAMPYQESQYRAKNQSFACAKGYWQFMPEVAYRVGRDSGLPFKVKDCTIKGVEQPWSPTTATFQGYKNSPYIDLTQGREHPKCRIKSCRYDDRINLEKSTAAAMFTLKEAWNDGELAESGAAVQITILTHNAGYNDARFGRKLKTNLLPAYKRWRKGQEEEDYHRFYGENIKCATPHEGGGGKRCGAEIPAETQHYAYSIIAQHLLAVCYYGLNYDDKKEFKAWGNYTKGKGYCTALDVPTATEVRNYKGGKKGK